MTSALPRHDAPREASPSADAELGRLFIEHADRIFAHCLRRVPTRPDAEDAVQLTFLHALRALRRGVVPQRESAWLHAIARNVCREQLRAASRRPSGDALSVESLAGPDLAHDERDALAGLVEALETIPERQRRALVLREWRGLSALEIADHLDLSAPATHALLTRARRSLVRAVAASKRTALGVASLGYELRHWIKAAAGATSVKMGAVAAAVVVAGAGGVGIASDRGADAELPASPALESRHATGGLGDGTSGDRGRIGAGALAAEQRERDGSARSIFAARNPATPLASIPGLERGGAMSGPWTPRPEPGPAGGPAPAPAEAPGPSEPAATPEAATPEAEPKETELPLVDPPPVDLPAIDPPPVDLPPIEVPEVDLPGDDALPFVELPPVDLPPVDLPPVDLPSIDVPPLGDPLGHRSLSA